MVYLLDKEPYNLLKGKTNDFKLEPSLWHGTLSQSQIWIIAI